MGGGVGWPRGGTGRPREGVLAEWERLERLRVLWEVHNPKVKGGLRSHRRILGFPVRVAKSLFRFFFQPFINEVLDRQTTFDENAVALLEKMRVARLARWEWLAGRLGALEERADLFDARGHEVERRPPPAAGGGAQPA